jgi:subtilisin family serine protease
MSNRMANHHHVRGWTRPWAVIVTLLLLVAVAPPTGSAADDVATGAEGADVHPDLAAAVAAANGDRIQALLVADRQADTDRLAGDRAAVVEALQDLATATRADIEGQVEQRYDELGRPEIVNWFWLQNMGLVEFDATPAALAALAGLAGADRLVPNFEVTVIEPETGEVGTAVVDDRTWGIDRIEAHRVQDELGIDGAGVVVATLDTGVDITHPDLTGRMVTDAPTDPSYPGGWMEFDGSGSPVASQPHDTQYHGTHVAGTIHGGDASGVRIGVAPGAQMMHGLVIPGGGGSFAQVAAGMQWAIAPFDASGAPAGQPADIVNMSLGGNGFHQEMVAPTRNMRAAGVFPAFAIGNNCGTAGTASPGNVYEAVGIGATDSGDTVAGFSCGGVIQASSWPNPPADWPASYVKPDLSAPGVAVYSAVPGNGYNTLSGTSMAAPHTAGTVALMLQAAPELDPDTVEDQLADTSFFDDRHGADRPNTRFGEGRINAYAAVEPIAIDSGIEGVVVDAASDEPVAGATVENLDTGSRTTTRSDGSFALRAHPGTYDLAVAAFGYEAATVGGIEVVEDTFTHVDVALTPLPVGAVAGTVTLAASGHGVPGVPVELTGTELSTTTGSDGSYLFPAVPIGTYEVAATPAGLPTPEPQAVTVEEGSTATADFELDTPAGDIAVVGTDPGGRFATYFDQLGIEVSVYPVSALADAATHRTIVWAYNPTNPGEAAFQQFLADTDASGAGVVFLDAAFGTWNGVKALSAHTGHPVSVSTSTGGTGQANTYHVTDAHPVLDGFEVGDVITHDATSSAAWIAWWDTYAGGERQTIAEVGRSGEADTYGGGIGVEQRANNRHVLLALHSQSATRGPAEWTAETEAVFWNAMDWVSPELEGDFPLFVTSNLEVAPDVVLGGEPVDVSVDVTNVGTGAGEHTAVLRVGGEVDQTTTVTLDAGESTTIEWVVTRDEVGTYAVEVAHLGDSFRVRAPVVALTARTVQAPGVDPGPLADATVELLHDGDVVPVGTTDADGALTFETPVADADYTVIVRRAAVDGHDHAYLLARPQRIDADTAIEFAPRTVVRGRTGHAWDLSATVDLRLDEVDGEHRAWSYLRSSLVAPYAFAFAPGSVVTTVADAAGFEAVHVHAVPGLERDWWGVSDPITGLGWRDPIAYEHRFGGPAGAELEASFDDGTLFTTRWRVSDAHGHAFEELAATDLRGFDDLPEVLPLEDVAAMVRGHAGHPGELVLRLDAPDGTPVHAGGLTWSQRELQRDLAELVDEVEAGGYGLRLEVATGHYSGALTADTTLGGDTGGGDCRGRGPRCP